MYRLIFSLFYSIVITIQADGGVISNQPRMTLRSFNDAAELKEEINRMVAMGWTLFRGEFSHAGGSTLESVRGKELILFKDRTSPVYRRAEKTMSMYSVREKILGHHAFISEGWVRGRKKLDSYWNPLKVVDNSLRGEKVFVEGGFIKRPSPGNNWEGEGFYEYTLVVPETDPGEVGMPVELQLPWRNTDLYPSTDYQIYKGTANRNGKEITETITIDGNNPYVVYRYTQEADPDGTIVAAYLSIGKYPHYALNPFFIQAVVGEGSSTIEESYELYQDENGTRLVLPDDEEIPLSLVQKASVWKEFEENIGITGAGIKEQGQ